MGMIPKQPKHILFPAIAHLYRTSEPIYTYHAKQRMEERSITERQIESIVTSAYRFVCEPRKHDILGWAYKVTDKDNHVHVVLGLDPIKRKIVIITVMYNSRLDMDDSW